MTVYSRIIAKEKNMTFGQKLKKLRIENNLTQKDLADQLHVTFQTVSKWENDTNEPDLSTLKDLSKILNCSLETLLSTEGEQVKEVELPIVVATCSKCGKKITKQEEVKRVKKPNLNGEFEEADMCENCANEYFAKVRQSSHPSFRGMRVHGRYRPKGGGTPQLTKDDHKQLIFGILGGLVALGITLAICIANYEQVGLALTILLPIIISYAIFADIYCIFTYSYIGEVFLNVSSWSIHFPGLIFTLDLEGLAWLIAMKIIFAILGAIIGLFVFLFAVALSAFLAMFSFVPIIIHNRKHGF